MAGVLEQIGDTFIYSSDTSAVGLPDFLNKLSWNEEEDTLSILRSDGGTREVGKDISDGYTNLDNTKILNGDICSIISANGNRSAVMLTDATNDILALSAIGMCTVDEIDINQQGEIAKIGKVHLLDTSAFIEGTKVYVDLLNRGKLTNVKPTAGRVIEIGTVVVTHHTEGVIDLNIVVYPFVSDLQKPMNIFVAQATSYTYSLVSTKQNNILNNLVNGINNTITLPTPIVGNENESVLHFSTGAIIPTLVYSGFTPLWLGGIPLSTKINKKYTITFEQVRDGVNSWIVKTSWGEY